MQITHFSLVLGLAAIALAGPSRDHAGRYRSHGHLESGHRESGQRESGHVSASGMPYPIGNGTNVTALSGTGSGVSRHTIYSTRMITITAPSPTATISKAAETADDKKANTQPTQTAAGVEDKVLADQPSAAGDDCNVVTVTSNPTVTVTVGAASSNAGLSLASSAPAQSPGSSSAAAEALSSSSTPLVDVPAPSVAKPLPVLPPSSAASAASLAASSSVAAVSAPVQSAVLSAGPVSIAASASASSSAPVASSSGAAPANNAGFRTKRGILASGSGQLALVSGLTPYNKISWLGDWYSGPPTNLPSTMQFVPQNYGKQSDVDGGWTSNAKKAVAAGDKYFLSFGEPGTPNAQLYLDPQDAVTLFMQKMQPYAEQGVTIGAPGTLQNDQDFAWLSSFLDLCDKAGCSIGFIAAHWFWEATQAQNFKDTVTKFVTFAKGKPVWVDNFQGSGTADEQKAFLQEVVPWLEEQPGVVRYAYVPVDPGKGEGFLNDDGKTLSDLGAFYGNL